MLDDLQMTYKYLPPQLGEERRELSVHTEGMLCVLTLRLMVNGNLISHRYTIDQTYIPQHKADKQDLEAYTIQTLCFLIKGHLEKSKVNTAVQSINKSERQYPTHSNQYPDHGKEPI